MVNANKQQGYVEIDHGIDTSKYVILPSHVLDDFYSNVFNTCFASSYCLDIVENMVLKNIRNSILFYLKH